MAEIPITAPYSRIRPKLFAAGIEFFGLLALLVAVVSVVNLDAVVLGDGISEESFAENLQSLLALGTGLIFVHAAVRYPQARAYLVLVATMCGLIVIRENDYLLDFVWHGFWKWPALMLGLVGVIIAQRHSGTLAVPFLQHFQTRSGAYMYCGFLLLVVFSRLFGTGSLWEPIMGEAYDSRIKTIVQEGLETLGSALITYGAVLAVLQRFGLGTELQLYGEVRD
ncbi:MULTISPECIES: hypothetical protein [Roseobacteraceae]|jgi:hypothetical protein|uniref:Uncharacterized protein n=1 Tax=Pseudosulfitobacter pseudonitzschiae TaxID=1402135 RepID=A0A221JZS6_9RHOB|nr:MULTISPECIES: hypothetical protein [Roseobacteraceae]ASM72252.1 hypothetical protein SULPSESMR1_01435 [Pseudosulfitobacter pseudonitzschiae]